MASGAQAVLRDSQERVSWMLLASAAALSSKRQGKSDVHNGSLEVGRVDDGRMSPGATSVRRRWAVEAAGLGKGGARQDNCAQQCRWTAGS